MGHCTSLISNGKGNMTLEMTPGLADVVVLDSEYQGILDPDRITSCSMGF